MHSYIPTDFCELSPHNLEMIRSSLSERNLLPGLVVTDSNDSKALAAVKNIRNAKAMSVEGFSVYEAVKFENLIVEKAALEKLLGRLV